MTQKQQNRTVIEDGENFMYQPIPVLDLNEVKLQRLMEIKQTVEHKLQLQLTEASRARKLVSTAKTDYKRKFYDKKFARINKEVQEQILVIQQIDYLINKNKGEVDASAGTESAPQD